MPSRAVREIILIAGCFGIGLLFVTLFSYSPDDPAWSASGGDSDTILNWGGLVGAYTADIALSVLGNSAYLLCAIAFAALYAALHPPLIESRLAWHWCLLGIILFIISSAALENIRFVRYAEFLPSGAGGGLGGLVVNSMRYAFGETGTIMLLLCFWIISWSLAVGMSWFVFFESIGAGLEKGLLFFIRAVKKINDHRIQQKVKPSSSTTLSNPEQHFTAITRRRKLKNKPKAPPPQKLPEPLLLKESSSELLPPESLLDPVIDTDSGVSQEVLEHNATLIEQTLENFGVRAKVLASHPGPVITRYDILPDTGVKGAQIVSLVRDLARALSVVGVRVLETIPGSSCMGLEIPNKDRMTVYFADVIHTSSYSTNTLPLALGKDAAGKPLISDLAKMPHLLVAGATGAGKSVCINAMLLSLLYSSSPDNLRLLLIDPKMLELAVYHDIPHLLAPVVTDVNLAPAALNWAVQEMENRYRQMSTVGARNIVGYNAKVRAGEVKNEEGENVTPFPYIVIVIDELADLMMTIGKKVEITISRLAQKARAAGIHLILATQRPSVDVITGVIKANVPCRIAFQVASKVDSRTIIDQMGAEVLLGMGDMLYLPAGAPLPMRVHGAYVSDNEVVRVASHLRKQGKSNYAVDFNVPLTDNPAMSYGGGDSVGNGGESDDLYDQAVEAVLCHKRPSISLVQRKLRIGYNRAARIIEDMEKAGLISAPDNTGARKILAPNALRDD
ncbi:DNA translocase FtsK 4TM domain-containing protein [Candidatus Persebacteraceae bacterium Df01]|jgi:S-DNA-T family DNA segregation ATPase FtsK/SpoIIIE|uniref:DNA translocase FtsK n=1 Tax=Candidatus Doriopsillibacter californiensis TaxID=2970740 RepID=A0ABT7QME7_9GAMM|nr:DNA translocase FtsK 4TM domain-containing protein [Candidatus Persebacteraceae bacterium Df01]